MKIFPQSIGPRFTQVTKMTILFCILQIMYDVLNTGGRKTWTPEQLKAQRLTHFPADTQTKQQLCLTWLWFIILGEKTTAKMQGNFCLRLRDSPSLFLQKLQKLLKNPDMQTSQSIPQNTLPNHIQQLFSYLQ